MGEFSPLHWLVVIVVVLIIFGPKRLPEIGRSLGEGIREFKKSLKEASSSEAPEKVDASKSALTETESKKQ